MRQAQFLGNAIRVDLSSVVSRWVGETGLRQVFDAAEAGGVILLFDEADAIFGKRSEVKDSQDRYSNIEVSYLLQRMENFRGWPSSPPTQSPHWTRRFSGACDFQSTFLPED